MKPIHRIALLTAMTGCLVVARARAQQEISLVSLDERVGPLVDAGEAERFGIFRQQRDFESAVVLVAPGDSYYVCIRNTAGRDQAVPYPEKVISMLAERIRYYERIEKGTYVIGSSPRRPEPVTEIPGELRDRVESARLLIVQEGRGMPDSVRTRETTERHAADSAARAADSRRKGGSDVPPDLRARPDTRAQLDLLPFAADAAHYSLNPLRVFGFGLGVSTYLAQDLSGIERVHRAIESKYRNQGYSIQERDPDSVPATLVEFMLRVRFSRAWVVSLASNIDKRFSATALSLEYRHPFAGSVFVHGFLGAGVGRYGFDVQTSYGDRISPYDGNGAYAYLDYIRVYAHGIGFPLSFGIELEMPDGLLSLVLQGRYLAIPELTKSIDGAACTINMSSLTFCGTLMFYL